ncbi:MAG: VCBS repeat-containing protein, partial [Bdellovibrionales bacterium]|nr:VCBS repeat-containing protein [Bdellovibrionales bacterium]
EELAVGTGLSTNSVIVFHNLAPQNPVYDESVYTSLHTLAKVDEVHLRDINGDEKLDVIALESASYGGKIEVFLNLTELNSEILSFSQPILFVPDSANSKIYYDLAIEDLDGDGDLDFVLPEYNSGKIEVYLQSNGVVFNSIADQYVSLGTNAKPQELILADFDGDHIMDVAVTDWYLGDLQIFSGDPSQAGLFLATPSWSDPSSISDASQLVAIDLDGDQKIDLAYTEEWSGMFAVYKNTTQSGVLDFSSPIFATVSGAISEGLKDLTFSDINNDGIPDALVTHRALSGGDSINIFIGNGDGSFQSALDHYFYSEVSYGNIVSIDAYNRGYQDLVYLLDQKTLIINPNNYKGNEIAGEFVKDSDSLFSSFTYFDSSVLIEPAPFNGGGFYNTTIFLSGGEFNYPPGTVLTENVDYQWINSVSNGLDGLTTVITVNGKYNANLHFSGKATNHTPSNNMILKISFSNQAISTNHTYDPNKKTIELRFRSPIVMYNAGLTNANLGGANGALQTCTAQKPSGFNGFTVIAPFLSLFNITSFQYAAFFGLDDQKGVYGINGSSFGKLESVLDPSQDLYRSLVNGSVIDGQSAYPFWWSGWTYTGAAGQNASAWTSSSSGAQAKVGGAETKSVGGFLDDHTAAGNDQAHLLCVMSEPN